jgi:hypothetical protein
MAVASIIYLLGLFILPGAWGLILVGFVDG